MLIYNKRKCCICVSTICCIDENQMLHPPTSSSSSKVSRLLLSSQLFCIHVNYTLYSCILEAVSTYVNYEGKYEILRKFLCNEPVFSDWFLLWYLKISTAITCPFVRIAIFAYNIYGLVLCIIYIYIPCSTFYF